MEIKEVDSAEYTARFSKANHVFNQASFNELNKNKVEIVKYLVFLKKEKIKYGIIGGINNQTFFSPFSAPYGGWCYSNMPDPENMDEAYSLIDSWSQSNNLSKIRIIFPPLFYNLSALSLFFNIASRKAYTIEAVDLNFHFDLSKFNHNYLNAIEHNGRRNYNIAQQNKLKVEKVTDKNFIQIAYEIIVKNRQQRNYPLKMSFNDILSTSKIIEMDFFITYNIKNIAIASAIVFKITDKIAQIVYWGHDAEHTNLRPINFLSYNLFKYYKDSKFDYLDIGPATENGAPNYGLMEFKHSIGCNVSPKLTFQKIYRHEKFR
jgi:hypothetical protein